MTRQYVLPATEGSVSLTSFDVSPDGKFLAASGNNGMLYLRDMQVSERALTTSTTVN